MGSKGKIFTLAADCNHLKKRQYGKRKKRRLRAEGNHYDSGTGIQLSYDLGLYPQEMSETHGSDLTGESHYEAPFEYTESESDDHFTASFMDEYAEDATYEELEEAQSNYDDPGFHFAEESGLEEVEVESWGEEGSTGHQALEFTDDEEPTAAESMGSTTTEEAAVEVPEEVKAMSDDEFAADLTAILRGEKAFDPEAGKTVEVDKLKKGQRNPADSAPSNYTPEKTKEKPEEPKKDEHEIFEKIAQSMKYANAYDLGAIALEERFDQFDQQLEKEEITSIAQAAEKGQTKPTTQQDNGNETGSPEKNKPKPIEAPVEAASYVEEFEQKPSFIESEEQSVAYAFEAKKPLDFTNGGWSVGPDSLQPGDIILSTTSDPEISKRIRTITNSAFSHAGVYVGGAGNGSIIEAIEDPGVVERTLDTAMKDDTVTLALRHDQLTPSKAEKLIKFLREKRGIKGNKAKFDKWAVIKNLPIQVIASHCAKLSPKLRDKCRDFAGRVFMGTESNDEFYCSELVFEAFKSVGLSLTNTHPHWTSPEDLVQLGYNGTLRYVGHLKLIE